MVWDRGFSQMKIASHHLSRRTRSEYEGFTLIELLVVISIIAVLAGLLFPAMGAVRTMARKTSAKNDVTQIVNAVKMFYTEYGRYPLPAGEGTFTDGNGTLLEVLRMPSGASNDAIDLNPRRIRFLEVGKAKNSRNGLDGDSATADWLDPWGESYLVFISTAYNGRVTASGLPRAKDGTALNAELETEVAAASMGPPKSDGTKPTSGGSGFDPVASWR